VRANGLVEAFPVTRSTDFGLAPALLRTLPDAPIPVPLGARGLCRPGDLLVLATDAVAQWLCRTSEEGTAPDWDRLMGLDEHGWSRLLQELRRDDRIVNDDCTLLFLRIGEGRSGFAGAIG
jgi:hypothetical protein